MSTISYLKPFWFVVRLEVLSSLEELLVFCSLFFVDLGLGRLVEFFLAHRSGWSRSGVT